MAENPRLVALELPLRNAVKCTPLDGSECYTRYVRRAASAQLLRDALLYYLQL